MTGTAWLKTLHPLSYYTIETPEVKRFAKFAENPLYFLTHSVTDWFIGYHLTNISAASFQILFPHFLLAAYLEFTGRACNRANVVEQLWFVATPPSSVNLLIPELKTAHKVSVKQCTAVQILAAIPLRPLGFINSKNIFCCKNTIRLIRAINNRFWVLYNVFAAFH